VVCDRTWARGTEARERSRLCGFCDRGILFGFGLGLAFASCDQFFFSFNCSSAVMAGLSGLGGTSSTAG
jgi:hypothetical protein